MADLGELMDDLGSALGTIAGLRAHPYYLDKVTPPAAIVGWPEEYNFDSTFQRGSDQITFPVSIVVGRADARSSRDRLSGYCNGDGPESVKFAVENFVSTTWDSARVTKVEFGAVTIASINYLAATFDVELQVPGKGN